ncbi:MAG: hypothetical protein BIFFINMI_02080 [Phycisphaerae bacterium]|nr:hypothetical protein [Phycisphaerae bacterium]
MSGDAASSPVATRGQLADALARAGVTRGDTLLVHSSLKSLGRMEGGAAAVVEALLDAVGPTGNVAAPTHTCYAVREFDTHVFDPATSPSEVGAITEALRLHPRARRSFHPTHSVSAIGPDAEGLTAGHDVDGRTLSRCGPHGRLVRANARIVFIGCGLVANTTYHAAEDWLRLPFMPTVSVRVRRGGEVATVQVAGYPSGHRNFYRGSPDPRPTLRLAGRGLIVETTLNAALIQVVRARDVIRETCALEMEHPGATLCDSPACDFCREGRRACLREREAIAARAREIISTPALSDPAAPTELPE